MPIEQSFLGDFSRGEISAISSVEPQQGNWLLLEGLVLEENVRLRSQWAGATWIVEVEGSEDDSSSAGDSSSS